MPGEEPSRRQGDPVPELCTAFREKLLEDPAHREDGWAGLDGAVSDGDGAHLSARLLRPLEDRGVESGMSEPHGRGETTDPRSDHDDALLRHGRSTFSPGNGIDLPAPKCQ
jgi:hypothetical protein